MNDVRYQRILLTSDGSALAAAAAPHARELALRHEASLVLLAVIPSLDEIRQDEGQHGWIDIGGGLADEDAEAAARRIRSEALTHLDALAEELLGVPSVETHVLSGRVGPTIIDALDQLNADVLVMSTHGRSGLTRTLLGSVADHAVAHADRPIVLVPVRQR